MFSLLVAVLECPLVCSLTVRKSMNSLRYFKIRDLEAIFALHSFSQPPCFPMHFLLTSFLYFRLFFLPTSLPPGLCPLTLCSLPTSSTSLTYLYHKQDFLLEFLPTVFQNAIIKKLANCWLQFSTWLSRVKLQYSML
jgi:hypothetical protein